MNEKNSVIFDSYIKKLLFSNGYQFSSKVAKSLQGEIIKAKEINSNTNVVIKITNKELISKGITISNGEEIAIKENIISEAAILKWLTINNPPPYVVKYINCFDQGRNIFLIMEDGGINLFSLVINCHKLIENNQLSISEWQNICKILFKQMTLFIHWLHNKMNICHLDISLENLLVKNLHFYLDLNSNQIHFHNVNNTKIKYCDFGLAQYFEQQNFRCNKFVGKTAYQAPEIYNRKIFDARLGDVWSLGVVLFMFCCGVPPFSKPCTADSAFSYIINGEIHKLLQIWNKLNYVTPEIYDLLFQIFQIERKRITIDNILQHSWLQ